jgi:hypothetical protein
MFISRCCAKRRGIKGGKEVFGGENCESTEIKIKQIPACAGMISLLIFQFGIQLYSELKYRKNGYN